MTLFTPDEIAPHRRDEPGAGIASTGNWVSSAGQKPIPTVADLIPAS